MPTIRFHQFTAQDAVVQHAVPGHALPEHNGGRPA